MIFRSKKGKLFPEEFVIAHELCFVIHDVMLAMIRSGMEGEFFVKNIDLNDDEYSSLYNTDDIFSWLETEGRRHDRAQVVKVMVFPAILSDMLHCIFACLENSKKAKLCNSFILIRKPIQENLYLIESLFLDEFEFSEKLASDPLKFRLKNVGGIINHEERIQKVLDAIGENERLNASFIAKLRYDKNEFDGVCNKAIHLFTNHKVIQTEKLNINFIFSNSYSLITQWHYLYSHLPYILFYTYLVTERIIANIAPTLQEYLDDIQRKISALIILWWESFDSNYKCELLENFVNETEIWLNDHCKSAGYRMPDKKDLLRMSETGAFPEEKFWSVKMRNLKFKVQAASNRRT